MSWQRMAAAIRGENVEGSRRTPGRRRGAAAPVVEPLEGRVLLSGFEGFARGRASIVQVHVDGETLRVEGTPGPDRIRIGATSRPGEVVLFGNGRILGRYGPVEQVHVLAGAGHDLILASTQVRVPIRIEGGLGDDILRGGGGADQILGEEGNDMLLGSPGRDALDAGPGQNRVAFSRSMGVLHVSRAAYGEATRILSSAYTLQPLRPSGGNVLGPVVLGVSDLEDSAMLDLAKRAFEAGHTVALAGGSIEHARRLRDAIGHVGGADWDESASTRSALIAYRRVVRPDGAFHHGTDILMPRVHAQITPDRARVGNRLSDASALESLTRVFAVYPFLIETIQDTDLPNLVQIADSYASSGQYTDSGGNAVQVQNAVWNVRSFDNGEDFYYTFQEADFTLADTSVNSWSNQAYGFIFSPAIYPTISQMSPETTMESTQDTTSVAWNVSGTVGYSQGGVAEASGGVTITHSKTITIPPVDIINTSNTDSGEASWQYNVNDLPNQREVISFYNSWIWEVPFTDYVPDEGGFVQFRTGASLAANGWTPYVGVYPFIPMPFGETFQLDQPEVKRVNPSTVFAGDTFVINGTGLYPALVTAVLIDGEALSTDQYTPVSPTQIEVVAPNMFGLFLPVVVHTTQGISNDDVEIAIIGT